MAPPLAHLEVSTTPLHVRVHRGALPHHTTSFRHLWKVELQRCPPFIFCFHSPAKQRAATILATFHRKLFLLGRGRFSPPVSVMRFTHVRPDANLVVDDLRAASRKYHRPPDSAGVSGEASVAAHNTTVVMLTYRDKTITTRVGSFACDLSLLASVNNLCGYHDDHGDVRRGNQL